ncbi:MAG: serine hydrolase domain-containing protein [Polyangiaceae bacterium]
MKRVRLLVTLLLALTLWSPPTAAAERQLYQVSGSLFGFKPPPPRERYRYGPFDGLSRDARFERLLGRLRERLAQKHVPGAAVAVVLDGHLAYASGVGLLRAGREEPVRAESLFRTASLSKMLVAATVLSLAERDGLDLERPLTQMLPYFRRAPGFDASRITAAMLLCHTAGVPDGDDSRSANLRASIEAHANEPLLSPPGRLFNYSNSGYGILAALIESQTKLDFDQVVRERVFLPSGMETASYGAQAGQAGLSAGHDAQGRVVWRSPHDTPTSRAAGGVIASVVDFARFTEVLLADGGDVLGRDSVRAMMTGRAQIQDQPLRTYGFGLFETTQVGLRVVEHAGSSIGFSSLLRLVPARGFAVVVFDNGPFAPDDVADAAMSAFLDVPEEPRPRVTTPLESWAAYTGI